MSNVKVVSFPHNDTLVSGLLEDYRWSSSSNGIAQITYSFPSGSDTVWPDFYGTEINSWSSLSVGEQQQVDLAFDLWESVANITFQKVADSGSSQGDIRISHSDEVGADDFTVAWAYLPSPEFVNGDNASEASGDIWLDGSDYTDGQGSFNFLTLLHEIGHAVGLSHPHDGRVIMPFQYDSGQYSVMSYNDQPDSFNGNYPASPMLLDIAATQYLYGANTRYHSGDDSYQFKTNGEISTVWDAGGKDTFDFSNQQRAVDVSLVAGKFSSIGFLDNVTAPANNNLAIAYDVVIENVIGSDFSDTIVGNSADNRVEAGLGNDLLDGGSGGDILVLNTTYASATITFTDAGVEVASSDGVDSLTSFEAIKFSDGYVSLLNQELPTVIIDEGVVGRVLSLYQAALNREPDVGGLNFWVNEYIRGTSLLDISQGFVNSVEFATQFSVNSNEDYLDTLYQNVLGREGEAGGVAFWLDGLNNGESYEQVLLGFSDSAENQVQVAPLLDSLIYLASNDTWALA